MKIFVSAYQKSARMTPVSPVEKGAAPPKSRNAGVGVMSFGMLGVLVAKTLGLSVGLGTMARSVTQ